ncbi:MAG: 4'-phosphopantetheinyl transferase superfamily protein [Gammaproteobacteria bacterium]|nr:4'-phosphopantetheinyl transferase superfamily protein [Gammaproteobacteria bacterium]
MKNIYEAGPPLLRQLESEVHVWFSTPEAITDPERLAYYAAILSPEESARHQRFHFDKDRHLFLVSHALVRRVLSAYIDVDPLVWQFSRNEFGRPEVSSPDISCSLRFNLTHTSGLAACVVTLNADCGIDAEKIHARGDQAGIAEKMFAEPEQAELKKLRGQAFLERFLAYWTLREAYCKALGVGIAHAKKDYFFEIEGSGQYRIRFQSPSSGQGRHWQFTVLRPGLEHMVAVAIRSEGLSRKEVVHRFIVP